MKKLKKGLKKPFSAKNKTNPNTDWSYFLTKILARKSVCYGEYTSHYCHNYTTDIWVFGLAVNYVAYQCRQRQNKYDGEQPDAHNTRDGIKEHFTCYKEL